MNQGRPRQFAPPVIQVRRLVAQIGVITLMVSLVLSAQAQPGSPPPGSATPGSPPTAAPSSPPVDRTQIILHMLDYVSVDYPEFVKNGKIVDQGEYDEQLEFVTQARALLEQLPIRSEQRDLLGSRPSTGATRWRC